MKKTVHLSTELGGELLKPGKGLHVEIRGTVPRRVFDGSMLREGAQVELLFEVGRAGHVSRSVVCNE